MQFTETRQVKSIKRIFRINCFRNTLCLRTRYEHDSSIRGEQHCTIQLGNAIGIYTDITCDRLPRRICASSRHFQRPYALRCESIKRELTKLPLGKSLCSRTNAFYFPSSNRVYAENREHKRIVDLGGVNLIWNINRAVCVWTCRWHTAAHSGIIPTCKVESTIEETMLLQLNLIAGGKTIPRDNDRLVGIDIWIV